MVIVGKPGTHVKRALLEDYHHDQKDREMDSTVRAGAHPCDSHCQCTTEPRHFSEHGNTATATATAAPTATATAMAALSRLFATTTPGA